MALRQIGNSWRLTIRSGTLTHGPYFCYCQNRLFKGQKLSFHQHTEYQSTSLHDAQILNNAEVASIIDDLSSLSLPESHISTEGAVELIEKAIIQAQDMPSRSEALEEKIKKVCLQRTKYDKAFGKKLSLVLQDSGLKTKFLRNLYLISLLESQHYSKAFNALMRFIDNKQDVDKLLPELVAHHLIANGLLNSAFRVCKMAGRKYPIYPRTLSALFARSAEFCNAGLISNQLTYFLDKAYIDNGTLEAMARCLIRGSVDSKEYPYKILDLLKIVVQKPSMPDELKRSMIISLVESTADAYGFFKAWEYLQHFDENYEYRLVEFPNLELKLPFLRKSDRARKLILDLFYKEKKENLRPLLLTVIITKYGQCKHNKKSDMTAYLLSMLNSRPEIRKYLNDDSVFRLCMSLDVRDKQILVGSIVNLIEESGLKIRSVKTMSYLLKILASSDFWPSVFKVLEKMNGIEGYKMPKETYDLMETKIDPSTEFGERLSKFKYTELVDQG